MWQLKVGLLLSDLLSSEILLHMLLCPSVLPASSNPLSRQRSKTQKTSALSALQRKEIVSTAIRCLDTKKWAGRKKPDSIPDMCKAGCRKAPRHLGFSSGHWVTDLDASIFGQLCFSFVCSSVRHLNKGCNTMVRNGFIYIIFFNSVALKAIRRCKTQALCELNLCWQHMIDSILQMGQISLLCLNLSFDYLHTDLATDKPKMLVWMNAHTYALHICECPLLYALLEEKIYLYTIILFFIHV